MITALKYGIIAGLLSCFWVISEYLLGLHNEHLQAERYTEPVGAVILLVAIISALKEIKHESPVNATFAKLAGNGMFISAITATIVSAFFIVYIHHLNPEWQQTLMSKVADELLKPVNTEEEMAAAADFYAFLSKDSTQFLLLFAGIFSGGSVMSLPFSLLYKTR